MKRSRVRRITKLDTTLPPPSPFLLALEGRAFFEWVALMLAWLAGCVLWNVDSVIMISRDGSGSGNRRMDFWSWS